MHQYKYLSLGLVVLHGAAAVLLSVLLLQSRDGRHVRVAYAATCGDTVVEEGEACDDGDADNGDGCSDSCFVENGWSCDGASPTSCSEICGDNTVVGAETCDGSELLGQNCSTQGFDAGSLACNGSCDGFVTDSCTYTCGNGSVNGAEACDDGNATVGDGCSDVCALESGWACDTPGQPCTTICPDGIVVGAEQCDDNNAVDNDYCTNTCTSNGSCGDSSVQEGAETCDDGNATSSDGCSNVCATESGWTCPTPGQACSTVCGDSLLRGAEACDDGNTADGDGCNSSCSTVESGWTCPTPGAACTTVCGDGSMVGAETCDDGNASGNDGCSAACEEESGWDCTGSPSSCAPVCGDAIVVGNEVCDGNNLSGQACADFGFDAGALSCNAGCDGFSTAMCTYTCGNGSIDGAETCDDGDTDPGDGCDASCVEEDGWTCTGEPSSCTEDFCGNTSCAERSTTYGNHNYYLFTVRRTWTEAEAACEAMSGYLVAITSEAENTAVATLADTDSSLWIGLNDSASEGTYDWVTADAFDYSNWHAGQPDNGGGNEDCVEMNSVYLSDNGMWNDIACTASENTGFICEIGACGDGAFDLNEVCDDDNTTAGDGCSANCQAVETGWTCDGSPSVCSEICGDGNIVGDEECDDDDTDNGDGCSSMCVVEEGWVCEDEPSVCTDAVCGNGAIEGAEACDDGDATGGDGCSALCAIESGYSCNGEPSTCTPSCGDGIKAGAEACDDGDLSSGDGCSSTCTVETGYSCNNASPNVCSTVCGDGYLRGSEQCDDSNLNAGDGCSATCNEESGFICTDTSPSICSALTTTADTETSSGSGGGSRGGGTASGGSPPAEGSRQSSGVLSEQEQDQDNIPQSTIDDLVLERRMERQGVVHHPVPVTVETLRRVLQGVEERLQIRLRRNDEIDAPLHGAPASLDARQEQRRLERLRERHREVLSVYSERNQRRR